MGSIFLEITLGFHRWSVVRIRRFSSSRVSNGGPAFSRSVLAVALLSPPPRINALQVEPPVTPDLESRQLTVLNKLVDSADVNRKVIRQVTHRHHRPRIRVS